MFWRRGDDDDGDHDVGQFSCSIIKRSGLQQTAAAAADRQPPRLQFGRQGKRVMTYRPDAAAGAGAGRCRRRRLGHSAAAARLRVTRAYFRIANDTGKIAYT